MKILVPVKRVVDFNVRIGVKPDGSGVDRLPGRFPSMATQSGWFASLMAERRRRS